MSMDTPTVSLPLEAGHDAAPLAWMLALLREVIEGVRAEDQPPSKKANAIARLANLYLKTYHAAALERVNAGREERIAEREECPAACGGEGASGAEADAGQAARGQEGSTAAVKTGKPTPPSHPSGGTTGGKGAGPNPRQKPAKSKSAARSAAPRGRRK